MKLDLHDHELNIVMEALSQAPFRVVAPVIQKIQMQVMAQQSGMPAPPSVDKPQADENAAGGTD